MENASVIRELIGINWKIVATIETRKGRVQIKSDQPSLEKENLFAQIRLKLIVKCLANIVFRLFVKWGSTLSSKSVEHLSLSKSQMGSEA